VSSARSRRSPASDFTG